MKKDGIKRIKTGLILVEATAILVLVCAILLKASRLKEIPVNLADFASDLMTYDGSVLSVPDSGVQKEQTSEASEEDDPGYLTLRIGDLKAGSYTLSVQYDADIMQFATILPENSHNHSHLFKISGLKHKTDYRFWLDKNVENVSLSFRDYQGGEFRLSGISVKENTRNLQILLFLAITVLSLSWFFLFSRFYRNHRHAVLIVIALTLLSSVMLLINGMSLGHDSDFHLARIEAIAEGLRTGQFPVRMYPFVNDDYGYPAGIFYGDLLLYVPAILRIIGITVINSYKCYILFVSLLTAASIYFCASSMFRSEKTAALVSFAYMVSSYRFLDIFVRSAVGEYTSFIFFPLIFLAMRNLCVLDPDDRQYGKNALWLGIGMAGLIHTHILSTEIVMTILVVYSLASFKKTFRKKTFLTILKGAGIAFGLSLMFLVPFVHYYLTSNVNITHTADSIHHIQEFGAFISEYFAVFRDFYGYARGEVSNRMQFTPGLIQIIALITVAYLMLSRQSTKEIRVTFLVSVIFLFVSSNRFPWNWLADSSRLGSILAAIQYPWRYLGPTVMTTSILVGLVYDRMCERNIWNNNTWYIGLILCFVMLCVFVSNYLDNGDMQHIIDSAELYNYSGTDGWGYSIGAREYTLPGTKVKLLDYEIKGENASGTLVSEKGVNLLLDADAGNNSWLEVPRFNLPYFQVTDENGTIYRTECGFNNKMRILFDEAYHGRMAVRFETPWFVRFADLFSICFALFLLVREFRKTKREQKEGKTLSEKES